MDSYFKTDGGYTYDVLRHHRKLVEFPSQKEKIELTPPPSEAAAGEPVLCAQVPVAYSLMALPVKSTTPGQFSIELCYARSDDILPFLGGSAIGSGQQASGRKVERLPLSTWGPNRAKKLGRAIMGHIEEAGHFDVPCTGDDELISRMRRPYGLKLDREALKDGRLVLTTTTLPPAEALTPGEKGFTIAQWAQTNNTLLQWAKLNLFPNLQELLSFRTTIETAHNALTYSTITRATPRQGQWAGAFTYGLDFFVFSTENGPDAKEAGEFIIRHLKHYYPHIPVALRDGPMPNSCVLGLKKESPGHTVALAGLMAALLDAYGQSKAHEREARHAKNTLRTLGSTKIAPVMSRFFDVMSDSKNAMLEQKWKGLDHEGQKALMAQLKAAASESLRQLQLHEQPDSITCTKVTGEQIRPVIAAHLSGMETQDSEPLVQELVGIVMQEYQLSGPPPGASR